MTVVTNLLGDPFWLTTLAISISGWVISLVGCIINITSGKTNRDSFPILTWWGLAFQFMCTMLVAYGVVTNALWLYRFALLALLAIATMYSTNSTNNFVWRDGNTTVGAIAAGEILLSIINILWIFYMGTSHEEPLHHAISSFAVPKVSTRYGRANRRPQYPTSQNGGSAFAKSNQSWQRGPQSSHGQATGRSSQAHPHAQYQPQYMSDLRGFENPQLAHQSLISGSTDQSDSLSVPTDYPYKARALYSYSANPEDGNEISFEKDEILEISDITGRWWQARRDNGEVGICPSNYVVLL